MVESDMIPMIFVLTFISGPDWQISASASLFGSTLVHFTQTSEEQLVNMEKLKARLKIENLFFMILFFQK
jgi:hypothetical protein